jgi:hypothetical protein
LARHEGNFRPGAQAPLSLGELLDMLAGSGDKDGRSREHAIACYLSGDEGWRDALQLLDGTFAEGAAGLRERKAD